MDVQMVMIKLQGDVKAKLLEKMREERAHLLAAEIAHIVFTSDLVNDEVKEFYENLS